MLTTRMLVFKLVSYACVSSFEITIVLVFYFQGRTALWDSILLLCHRVKVGYGGIVRGMHLGSSALNILSVLHSEDED